jgi:ABC-type branched-subunit amino acid transport system substrate-binding protein
LQPPPPATRSVLPPGQLIPGLQGNAPARPVAGLVRVGLLVPLSGPAAPVGQALLNAAEMALFDIGDEHFVLQVYDSQGTAEGAAKAVQTAISHGVQLILGPLFSAEAKAAAPAAAAAGINMITFSTDPSIASPHVFILGFLVQEQVRQIVAYARDQGLSRFAVLAPNSAYGQAVIEAFNRYVPQRGGKVAQVALYDPNGKDLAEVVRGLASFDQRQKTLEQQKAELAGKDDEISQAALKRLERLETVGEVNFDTILLPEQGARLTQAASLLSYYDIDPGRVRLLGTLLWDAPGLGREPVLVGGVYPAPPPDTNRQFFTRYRELYGRAAPTIATHGYDAVALAAILARSGQSAPFTTDELTAPAGFAGVDGIFRFMPDGLSQRGFAIIQVTRTGTVVVKPAPTLFDAAAY